jgi:SAM-dependent methyltransferase
VFLAASRVGPSGKSIGIDMTPEMIELARRNAAKAAGGAPFSNVEFHQATIDRLPLPDGSVDCVISNCVINLAPDKSAVFREIARVLRPGGRLAASDIALKRPLPPELGSDMAAYVGCIAGAMLIEEYRRGLVDAGFSGVQIVDSQSDLNAYAKVEGDGGCCSPAPSSSLPIASTGCCAPASPVAAATSCCGSAPNEPTLHQELSSVLERYNVNDYAASVRVYAVKP